MKQAPMKESSSKSASHSSHAKVASGHHRKGGTAPSSTRTKRHSHLIPIPESRNESSKLLSTTKSSTEKRVAWSKTPTDREHDHARANDDAKLGKNRSLLSRFKKKTSQEEHNEPSWHDCIQVVPATNEMNDQSKGKGKGRRTRSNPPEVRDDADRIDRSARGSSSRHNVNKDDSRHQNGKTMNLIDESDDESRHSNMEFSMGDFSDLSFPAVGDALLEKRLSSILNGTLGIYDDQKKSDFRNLLSVPTTKNQDKKNEETARKGIVPRPKQRTEEAKEGPEKVEDGAKSSSLETKQAVDPVAVKEEKTIKRSTIRHYVPQSPPILPSAHTAEKPLVVEPSSRNRSEPIREENPSVPDSPQDPSTEGTHIDPSTEGTHIDPSTEGTHIDPSTEGTPIDPSTGDTHIDPSNKDIVDSTDVESRQHGDGYCLENVSPPVCDAPSFTFLPDEDNVEVPVDCHFAAGVAAALNFLTAPLFAFVFRESTTNASHQNRTSEQEKKVLLDIVTSDDASKEDKEQALARLFELIENQEMGIDELPDFMHRNSFDSNVSGETYTTDVPDDTTSVTKSLESSRWGRLASRLERPKRRDRGDRYIADSYIPLVAEEEKSLTPSRDDEHDAGTVEENAVREANLEPTGESPPPSTSLSSAELKILKKHAQMLGIDVNVLINAKDEGQEINV